MPDPDAVAVSEDAQSTEPVDAELADQYDEAAATVYERVQEVVTGVVVSLGGNEVEVDCSAAVRGDVAVLLGLALVGVVPVGDEGDDA